MNVRAAFAGGLLAALALGAAPAATQALAGQSASGQGASGQGGPARPAVRISVRGGDPSRGAVVFQQCYACHSVVAGEVGLSGPNLFGVVGRAAGVEAGFDYSPALQAAVTERDLAWSARELDRFLADPEQALPGTSMAFVGLTDPRDRADVIAYLTRASGP